MFGNPGQNLYQRFLMTEWPKFEIAKQKSLLLKQQACTIACQHLLHSILSNAVVIL
jgi:hypothetical protein